MPKLAPKFLAVLLSMAVAFSAGPSFALRQTGVEENPELRQLLANRLQAGAEEPGGTDLPPHLRFSTAGDSSTYFPSVPYYSVEREFPIRNFGEPTVLSENRWDGFPNYTEPAIFVVRQGLDKVAERFPGKVRLAQVNRDSAPARNLLMPGDAFPLQVVHRLEPDELQEAHRILEEEVKANFLQLKQLGTVWIREELAQILGDPDALPIWVTLDEEMRAGHLPALPSYLSIPGRVLAPGLQVRTKLFQDWSSLEDDLKDAIWAIHRAELLKPNFLHRVDVPISKETVGRLVELGYLESYAPGEASPLWIPVAGHFYAVGPGRWRTFLSGLWGFLSPTAISYYYGPRPAIRLSISGIGQDAFRHLEEWIRGLRLAPSAFHGSSAYLLFHEAAPASLVLLGLRGADFESWRRAPVLAIVDSRTQSLLRSAAEQAGFSPEEIARWEEYYLEVYDPFREGSLEVASLKAKLRLEALGHLNPVELYTFPDVLEQLGQELEKFLRSIGFDPQSSRLDMEVVAVLYQISQA